ncbi:hypothetical protein L9F63_007677 [Diploptera punctata]|uniref:Uncharacterized protein n=1 Tax=Diploptera punctata TaxID=6984 RepID=A0AAD8E3Q0_DIPPU|nr:hypothetical protein L9F63_007677 [Diploptera punctata]
MQYFKEALGNKEVTVAVTPYGYGDTIATRHYVSDKVLKSKEYFVLPEERIMRMDTFVDVLQKRLKRPGVFYLQPQRSIIAEKFEELLPDIAPDISWASEAFNAKPQKIWHKDFILHPPTDIPWIPYKKYPVGKYKETTPGTFDILPHKLWACRNFEEEHLYNTTQTWNKYKSYSSQSNSDRSISMMDKSVDGFLHYLNNLDVEDDFKNKTRILVDSYLKSIEVKPSDTNFAPSGCCDIRADEQSHACIAVNYVYEMKFDFKYAYFKMLEYLAKSDLN